MIKNKFILLTRGRTGSTAVIDELNKINSFKVEQELFIKFDNIYSANFHQWKEKNRVTRWVPNAVLAKPYFNITEQAAFEQGASVFGFKVLSHHFEENPFLKRVLKKREYKVIYLTRSLSNQVISGMIAKQRNKYNSKDEYLDESQYVIDLDDFQNLVHWEDQGIKRDKAFLAQNGFEFIELKYEDFMSHRELFYENIFKFLEVPFEEPPPSDYKVMIKDKKFTIKNYEAVAEIAAKMGTPIEKG